MIMELAELGQIMKYDEEEVRYIRNKSIFEKVIEKISKEKDTSST